MGLVARSVCSSSNSSPRLRAKREEIRYSQMISTRPLKSHRIPSQLSEVSKAFVVQALIGMIPYAWMILGPLYRASLVFQCTMVMQN